VQSLRLRCDVRTRTWSCQCGMVWSPIPACYACILCPISGFTVAINVFVLNRISLAKQRRYFYSGDGSNRNIVLPHGAHLDYGWYLDSRLCRDYQTVFYSMAHFVFFSIHFWNTHIEKNKYLLYVFFFLLLLQMSYKVTCI